MSITYRIGHEHLTPADVTELYNASTLGLRRPVDHPDVMEQMYRHADLFVTAWDGPLLVGIARTVADFVFDGLHLLVL